MTNPTNQFDAIEIDMIRRGDMLGPKLGARVYDALAKQAARIAELKAENKSLSDEIDNLESEGCDYDDTIRKIETQLTTSRAECEGLRAERDELKRQVPIDRWYWPEDDTSSDACRDNPREALEYQKPGEIDGYSCGGVAYTNYFGWLPAADDSDSDDEFEVDEPTREAAKAKMQAEIERRAALSQKETGDA